MAESKTACYGSCWHAKSHPSECECFCGGENHGLGNGGAVMPSGRKFDPLPPEQMPASAVPGHYSASSGAHVVFSPEGRPLDLRRSLRLVNHSPTGFAWGYGGSGPAQLALAILLDQGVAPETALRFHQRLKFEVVARANRGEPLRIPRSRVERWIERNIRG